MRGKGKTSGRNHQNQGITPAYAGKSPHVASVRRYAGDHPRLCGEKFCSAALSNMTSGSPPPMRGKVKGCSYCAKYTRITPAYAGKSQHSERDSRKSEDHPRLCGEKIKTFLQSRGAWGSPPPMRGKGMT